MAIYIEDMLPGVKFNGLNTTKAVDFSGASSFAGPSGSTFTSSVLTTPAISAGTVTGATITSGTVTDATIGWSTTGASGGVLSNLKYAVATATSLASLNKSIQVSLGGVAYYIPAYATAN